MAGFWGPERTCNIVAVNNKLTSNIVAVNNKLISYTVTFEHKFVIRQNKLTSDSSARGSRTSRHSHASTLAWAVAAVSEFAGQPLQGSGPARAMWTPGTAVGAQGIFFIGIHHTNIFLGPQQQFLGSEIARRAPGRCSVCTAHAGRRRRWRSCSEKGVRLAQKVQVGPSLPVGTQL
jgi:hypothetical protein